MGERSQRRTGSTQREVAVLAAFPFLADAEPALREALFAAGLQTSLRAGNFICMEGNHCGQLPLVLSGTARVYKSDESGRELTLYRLDRGESCILTASCILSDLSFPAFAVAETDVEAFTVPAAAFRGWFDAFPTWRSFVLRLLSSRLAAVIEMVDSVTFQRMDTRLARHLLDAAESDGRLRMTHEAVAADLGTSREVISRMLRDFEVEGLVRRGRGTIYLNDVDGLRRRAGAS